MATLVVAIVFGALNFDSVSVNYLLGEAESPLFILLFVAFFFGLLAGVGLDGWLLYRQRIKISRLEKKAQSTEQELNNLRKMPLKGFGG